MSMCRILLFGKGVKTAEPLCDFSIILAGSIWNESFIIKNYLHCI